MYVRSLVHFHMGNHRFIKFNKTYWAYSTELHFQTVFSSYMVHLLRTNEAFLDIQYTNVSQEVMSILIF